ncbi:MAG: DUF2231 domain-containing protein [Polyangiaceae bacterium]
MARGLRFLGHPVHPMLTHFPMALLMLAPPLDAIALVRGEPVLWTTSFWMIAAGLGFGLVAAIAGMVDLAAIPDSAETAATAAQRHMLIMLTAVCLFGASLGFRGGSAAPSGYHLVGALACEAIGALGLMVGGWLGGHLVFHHRVGVDVD